MYEVVLKMIKFF